MHRGEIWVKDDRDFYVLVTSDHLSETRPPITWGIPLTGQNQPTRFATPFVIALSPTQTGLGVATWALIARGIIPTPRRRPHHHGRRRQRQGPHPDRRRHPDALRALNSQFQAQELGHEL